MPETTLHNAEPEIALRGRTLSPILIIDDEAGIRESLEVLLRLEGFVVETAVDGPDGWRRSQRTTTTCSCSISLCPARAGLICCRAFC